MAQNPFDQLAKQYLEDFLSPMGTVSRHHEVPGETKYVDVWFVPNLPITATIDDLGLLSEIVQRPALIEPFSSPPDRDDLDACLLKRLWIKEDERRKRENGPYPIAEQPLLWILASHVGKPLLKDFFARRMPGVPGLYTLGPGLGVRLVAIDELSEKPDTLWMRILGRGTVQAKAIREMYRLPSEDPRRERIMRLHALWSTRIDMKEVREFLPEGIVAYPQTFLDWEQATRDQGKEIGKEIGKQEVILRQVERRCGAISEKVRSMIVSLPPEPLEQLGEDLLDFEGMGDLVAWLDGIG